MPARHHDLEVDILLLPHAPRSKPAQPGASVCAGFDLGPGRAAGIEQSQPRDPYPRNEPPDKVIDGAAVAQGGPALCRRRRDPNLKVLKLSEKRSRPAARAAGTLRP
jgi:hypothetical protein